MKRTPLKRKTGLSRKAPLKAKTGLVSRMPLKRSKLGLGGTKDKKMSKGSTRKKLTSKQLQDKIWIICKRIIRARYGNTCYTCGKTGLEGSNWHTGHFIPKAACGAYLKYDLRNLRPQCYHCNINLGGNGGEFYRRMVAIEGQEYVDKLFQDKNIEVKAYEHYSMILPLYKLMEA